jgi:hypothetical protein
MTEFGNWKGRISRYREIPPSVQAASVFVVEGVYAEREKSAKWVGCASSERDVNCTTRRSRFGDPLAAGTRRYDHAVHVSEFRFATARKFPAERISSFFHEVVLGPAHRTLANRAKPRRNPARPAGNDPATLPVVPILLDFPTLRVE